MILVLFPPNGIHYGIKFELNKYYVYAKKDNRLGWFKRHGPFSTKENAEHHIKMINLAVERLCKEYHENKKEIVDKHD